MKLLTTVLAVSNGNSLRLISYRSLPQCWRCQAKHKHKQCDRWLHTRMFLLRQRKQRFASRIRRKNYIEFAMEHFSCSTCRSHCWITVFVNRRLHVKNQVIPESIRVRGVTEHWDVSWRSQHSCGSLAYLRFYGTRCEACIARNKRPIQVRLRKCKIFYQESNNMLQRLITCPESFYSSARLRWKTT